MAAEIIGRDEELAAVRAFAARPADGLEALVLSGEAGIGKSTLWLAGVDAARERGLRVLTVRPAEAEQQLALAGLADLLDGVVDEVLPELTAPQRRALEVALLIEDAAVQAPDPRALGVALRSALNLLARRELLAVAIDDVQWLDAATAGALEFALRRLEDSSVSVLLARRGDESSVERALPGGQTAILPVGPLSVGAIHGLLRERLGGTLPRPTLVRLHEASGGNPFYALELARALQRAGKHIDPSAPLPVPATLERLVDERLRALPEATRAALLPVAVAGAPRLTVVEAAGIERMTLVPAVTAQVLEISNGEVRFVHPLLASGVIAQATEDERRRAHRLVATAIDDPVARARHIAAGVDEPDDDTALFLEEAAERARMRGAPSVAAELGEAAVRSTSSDRVDDRRRRVMAAARDHLAAGSVERGLALAEELVEQARTGFERGEALALLGYLESRTGIATAVEHFREALRESDGRPELELMIHEQLALVTRISDGLLVAEAHAEAAVALSEQLGDDALAARALAPLAIVRYNRGAPESFALARRAVELARASGDARAIDEAAGAWGHCLLWSGRIDDARRVYTAQLQAVEECDEPAVAHVLWHLSLAEERAGELALAREYAERARELWLQYAGHEPEDPTLDMPLVRVAVYQGDERLARELAERACAYAEARGGTSRGRSCLSLLGILDHWDGASAQAVERFEAFDEGHQAAGFTHANSIHVSDQFEALLAVGRGADALELLDDWESESRRLGHRRAIPEVVRCRGLQAAHDGDVAAAITLLEEAVVLHEQAGDPFGRARALLLVGVIRRRARQKAPAREAIEAALAGFDTIGAHGWAAKARAELGRVGGRTRMSGLSPAEQRVAALVAEGRTNREVAAVLVLGERTVATHLTHVYAKLGIRSRTELARMFR